MPTLFSSNKSTVDSKESAYNTRLLYIAGFSVAGILVLGVLVWLAVRLYKNRAARKRENLNVVLGTPFLSVRGLMKEDKLGGEKGIYTEYLKPSPLVNSFSRDRLTATVVLPKKDLDRERAPSPESIRNYYQKSGTLPRPFRPNSFSFTHFNNTPSIAPASSVREASPGPPSRPTSRPVSSSFYRVSLSAPSVHSKSPSAHTKTGSLNTQNQSRFSIFSAVSSRLSSISQLTTSGGTRKVRQVFTPLLPDELLPHVNEHLTIMQSFDDGWCVVGREGSTFMQTTKSLFKASEKEETNVELGVVPAWCFMKPLKGLRAERPTRSSSLGVTVQIESPGFSSRDEVISWSNL